MGRIQWAGVGYFETPNTMNIYISETRFLYIFNQYPPHHPQKAAAEVIKRIRLQSETAIPDICQKFWTPTKYLDPELNTQIYEKLNKNAYNYKSYVFKNTLFLVQSWKFYIEKSRQISGMAILYFVLIS